MTNHPILFKSEMVRAILDERKTQTRRIIKPQPDKILQGDWAELCRWKPGDLLWVRESWWAVEVTDIGLQYGVFDDEIIDGVPKPKELRLLERQDWRWGHHPSIHMPKLICRLWLKVKSVRMERVQEITQSDAIAEGVDLDDHDITCMGDCANRKCDYMGDKTLCDIYHTDEDCPETEAFGMLWDSINTKRGYGWEVNPVVFVIEFERHE